MCLEETVAHCAAAMLTFIKAITEEVVATMQKDVTMLQAFFSKYLKQDKVRVQGRADNCCMGRGGLGGIGSVLQSAMGRLQLYLSGVGWCSQACWVFADLAMCNMQLLRGGGAA